MPPSCEAFGVLVYENCWSKWKHVHALEGTDERRGKKVRTFAKDSGKIKKMRRNIMYFMMRSLNLTQSEPYKIRERPH